MDSMFDKPSEVHGDHTSGHNEDGENTSKLDSKLKKKKLEELTRDMPTKWRHVSSAR